MNPYKPHDYGFESHPGLTKNLAAGCIEKPVTTARNQGRPAIGASSPFEATA